MKTKTHGFICAATSPEYVKLAYMLSLSLKLTYQSGGLSIVVSNLNDVDEDMKWAFDAIVKIPQPEGVANFYNRSFFFEASPYDYTMALDADMVFSKNIDPWWELLDKRPVVMGTALTYRNKLITNRQFREVFDRARLYDAYSACFMFDKSKKSKELFELMKDLFVNWNKWRGILPTPFCLTQDATTDVSLGIATKALGLKSAYLGWRPKFIHLKPELQDNALDEWVDPKICLSPQPYSYVAERSIIEIGRIKQIYPVHYFKKECTTDDRIKLMKECYHALC